MSLVNTKKKMINNINKLPNYVHLEIYNFLFTKDKIDNYSYTLNNNGFFYNINQLDNKTLLELNTLVNFYISNEKILEKRYIKNT